MIQEWWGLVPHIKDVCERFAAEGFVALAPDLYHGKQVSEPDEAGKEMMALQLNQAAKDLSGAVDAVAERSGGDGVGVVGFCMGGGLALVLAAERSDKVKAVVPFYGVLAWPGVQPDYSSIKAPVLGHYAELDESASPEAVRQLEAFLREAGNDDVTLHIYDGADHAFFNDDRPEVYDDGGLEARLGADDRVPEGPPRLRRRLPERQRRRCRPHGAQAWPASTAWWEDSSMSARTRTLPRRSCLSVPGSSERFLEKAPTIPADMTFLDLEDSVAPLEKEDARAKVSQGDPRAGLGRARPVRAGERMGHPLDLRRRHRGRLDSRRAARRGHAAEGPDGGRGGRPRPPAQPSRAERRPAAGHVGIEAQIETTRGLINVEEICAASPRLEAVIFGPADFAASMEMPVLTGGVQIPEYPGDHFHYVFSKILMAGRANGLQVIDGPFLKVREPEAFRDFCQRTRILGYDGKWALHPDQVKILNEIFSPTQEQFDRAWAILDAYKEATEQDRQGSGDVRGRDDRRGEPEDGAQVRHSRITGGIGEVFSVLTSRERRRRGGSGDGRPRRLGLAGARWPAPPGAAEAAKSFWRMRTNEPTAAAKAMTAPMRRISFRPVMRP